MIFNEKSTPIFEQFKKADEEQSIALKKLISYMESPGYDETTAFAMAKDWEIKEHRKMELWNHLQAFRVK